MSLSKKIKIPSPVETDSDKYKVIVENDKVRVFDYKDKPGDKTKMHYHDAFVLHALSPFKRKLHLIIMKVSYGNLRVEKLFGLMHKIILGKMLERQIRMC